MSDTYQRRLSRQLADFISTPLPPTPSPLAHSRTTTSSLKTMATSLTTFRLASRSTSAAHTRLSTGLLRRTYVTSPEEEEKDVHYVINCITQGHVTDPNNRHKRDPMSQAYRAGMQARILSDAEFDAASMQKKEVPHEMGRGNKEHVGWVDQVGSATPSAEYFENTSDPERKMRDPK
ncbi:hypothetical protein CC1G_07827 [Coprinopsis cinerea okayama7|uniref:Uncharacterized protein n=1 Tax=Coprinopsis cinerea (strain Okayama-7 / 130 / ATCC MYA-4618 / FGSC 9003) TaxID=240176 RepID=A8P3Y6_COPC7|nr:hypothetical protein CC1G_07827 [Coprinopsis cinerea okayama7\|eukprot:XP_001838636.2 hypothetical protein CC1G_07827 [Coprinopsis cinerea okayama7\